MAAEVEHNLPSPLSTLPDLSPGSLVVIVAKPNTGSSTLVKCLRQHSGGLPYMLFENDQRATQFLDTAFAQTCVTFVITPRLAAVRNSSLMFKMRKNTYMLVEKTAFDDDKENFANPWTMQAAPPFSWGSLIVATTSSASCLVRLCCSWQAQADNRFILFEMIEQNQGMEIDSRAQQESKIASSDKN